MYKNKQIKIFLKEKNISQKELGEKMGYTHPYLSKVLSGELPLTSNFKKKFIEFLDEYIHQKTISFFKDYEFIHHLKKDLKKED